jgi:EAL domain-containing protein (putative c-di-GMP-specific phosphodiesterase class I)
MPGRLLHLMINADALMRQGKEIIDNLKKLRHAGCRIILSHIGQDLEIFNHLTPHTADYLLLDQELVTNVHGNLMDEMMVTIVQGHAQRLGLKSIAGPTNQPLMMDTLSGIGIDLIFGDTISQPQPLDIMLNTSYFAIN